MLSATDESARAAEPRSSVQPRTWTVTLGWLILVVLAWGNIQRVRSLGMPENPPFWVVDAIPPVLSHLEFGQRADYTSLKDVSDTFYHALRLESSALEHDSTTVARAISATLSLDRKAVSRETILLRDDDKGLVDFVHLSFLIFGYASEKIVYLYFALLFISVGVFAASFRKNLFSLTVAGLFLVAHYLILPLVFYHQQLKSVLAPRFLPVLALMACLHCLMFITRPQKTIGGVAGLLLQVALLIFVLHLRSVTMWECALVISLGILAAGTALLNRKPVSSPGAERPAASGWRPATWIVLPAVLTVAAILGLNAYRKATYDPRYFKGEVMVTRPFWHNIISGFSFNPALVELYGFKIDDSSEAHAAGMYLTQQGRAAEWTAMGGMSMSEPWIWSTGFYRLRLSKYDLVARELFFSVLREHPVQCIATFVYYKPASLARHLLWIYGFRREVPDVDIFVSKVVGDGLALQLIDLKKNLDARHLRFILWDPAAVAAVLAFAFLLSLGLRDWLWQDWLPVVLLTAGSLIPTVVGYPGMHTVAEPTLMVAVCIYAVGSFGLSRLFAAMRAARSRSPAPSPCNKSL
jgi:hypothetical protein